MTPLNGAGPATEGTVNEAPKIGTGERRQSNSHSVSKPQGQLADLARCIQAEHEAVIAAVKSGAEHAMAAGDLLIQAKAKVNHGGWQLWLKENCAFSERTAQLYMQLAENRASTLHHLATKAREAHAAVVGALTGVVEHAIRCGNILAVAKKQTGHGRWTEFLRACDVGERQAQRYMQLARLAGQNRPRGTDLAGMTIKGAIKYLTPPKPCNSATVGAIKPATRSERNKPDESARGKRIKHVDILAIWDRAPPEERTKAINSVGFKPLFAALPPDWVPLIEKWLADRRQPAASAASTSAVSDDLTIPGILRRTPQQPVPKGRKSSKRKFPTMQMEKTIDASGQIIFAQVRVERSAAQA
jgi:hypothetical protein